MKETLLLCLHEQALHVGNHNFNSFRTALAVSNNHTVIIVIGAFDAFISFYFCFLSLADITGKSTGGEKKRLNI